MRKIWAIIVSTVFLLTEWTVLSLSGTIPEKVSFAPGVRLYRSIVDKEAALEYMVEDFQYPSGVYESIINTGSEANLQAGGGSETARTACVSGDRLYVSGNGRFWSVDTSKPSKIESGNRSGSGGNVFVPAGKKNFMTVWRGENVDWICFIEPSEEGEIAYPDMQDWTSGCLDSGDGSEGKFSFDKICDRAAELLAKQKTEKLEPCEAAMLAYFAAEGVILDYSDGRILFADSMTEPGMLVVYEQQEDKGREEVIRVPVSYEGKGAGRFMAKGKLYYADGCNVYACDFEGEPVQILSEEQPIEGLNYLIYGKDKLCVGALVRQKLISLKIDEGERINTSLPSEELTGDGIDKWLFALKDTFFIVGNSESDTYAWEKIE